jgi:hypothetical protein
MTSRSSTLRGGAWHGACPRAGWDEPAACVDCGGDGELDEPDTLELLALAPDPDRAARLSKSKIAAALNRANRRDIDRRTAEIQAALRASALRQPPAVQSAFAAIAAGEVRLISVLNA